jgi:hypothetical protein
MTLREMMAFLETEAQLLASGSPKSLRVQNLREVSTALHGVRCVMCDGEGWLEPIDGWSDGSYITHVPCKGCDGSGLDHKTEA